MEDGVVGGEGEWGGDEVEVLFLFLVFGFCACRFESAAATRRLQGGGVGAGSREEVGCDESGGGDEAVGVDLIADFAGEVEEGGHERFGGDRG